MTLTHFAIIAVCAYLLGSLSFAIIVSKLTLGKDIRNYGSGNAGLTNAYRTMGAKKTLLVLLGDIAKGAAAVSIGMVLAGPVGKLTAGIFVILGHMFPLYFGFKGGKGVLHIAFYSDAQLQQFAGLLGQYDPEQAAEAADPSGEDEA